MTREDSILYAYEHEIPIAATKEKVYSIDDNIWGRAIECGEMEDPWNVPPPGVWLLTKPTATEPVDVVVGFDAGVPVSLDGEPLSVLAVVQRLNELVGSYGWGRLDMVENRRVGIKSRETYECPASLALILAHRDLEGICLEQPRGELDALGRVDRFALRVTRQFISRLDLVESQHEALLSREFDLQRILLREIDEHHRRQCERIEVLDLVDASHAPQRCLDQPRRRAGGQQQVPEAQQKAQQLPTLGHRARAGRIRRCDGR